MRRSPLGLVAVALAALFAALPAGTAAAAPPAPEPTVTSSPVAAAATGSVASATTATVTGNPYWPGWDIARGIAVRADGTGGYIVDGWGGLHAVGINGPAPARVARGPYWRGWDIARGVALLPDGSGGYVLDGWGGLHPFAVGTNAAPPPAVGAPYWPGWDIARGVALTPAGTGGYVVDAWGGLHPFAVGPSGTRPPALTGAPYWAGIDEADDITFLPSGAALVVDGQGRVYDAVPAGTAFPGRPAETGRWGQWDIIRGIAAMPDGTSFVLDGWGGLHRYAAPRAANATNFSFMGVDSDGTAIRYDPCTPLHYVINPASAPAGGVDLVHQAISRLSAATGLRFVYDGTTTEPPSTTRSSVQSAYYGNRVAPILVAWTNPSAVPGLADSVAGLAGSAARSVSPGRRMWITGLALLDGPQLAQFPTGFGTGVTQGDIVLHELMHVLGLGHVDVQSELMYPTATYGPATFGIGDLAGLRRLGSALGCIPGAAAALAAVAPSAVTTGDAAPAAAAPEDEWFVAAASVPTAVERWCDLDVAA